MLKSFYNKLMELTNRIRITFLFIIYLFSSFSSVQAKASPFSVSPAPQTLLPVTVQLNWHHQFQFAGFYAAIEQGYFKQAGLKVRLKAWHPGIDVVKEVSSGRADFGVAYSNAVVDFIKGAPIRLIMPTFQYSPVILLSHKPVDKLEDLKGLTVMASSNLLVESLMHRVDALTHQKMKWLPSTGRLQDFIEGKTDLYMAYETNEPFVLKSRHIPYYEVDPKKFGLSGYEDLIITNQSMILQWPKKVFQFKQALQKGWTYALQHPKKMVNILLNQYPVTKSKAALLFEADLTQSYVKVGGLPIGHMASEQLIASARAGFEAGLITQKQYYQFQPKQFMFNAFDTLLTKQELAYLQTHPVVKLANDIDWLPFEGVDSDGQYKGMAHEFLQLIARKTGLHFKPTLHKPWEEVVNLAQAGQLDMYSCAVATPDREKYMHFTQPYLSFPMVLAGSVKDAYVGALDRIKNKTIAVIKGYWTEEYIKRHYPHLHLILVKNIEEGLLSVLNGRADYYVGNLGSINYAIKHHGWVGLKILAQLPKRFELAMGVQKNNPLLFSIINKTLKSITPEEKNRIYSHWVQLQVLRSLSVQERNKVIWIVGIIVGFFILIVLFLLWARLIQKRYLDTFHELTFANCIDAKTLKITWVSDSFCQLIRMPKESLLGLSYPSLAGKDWSKSEIEQVKNQLLAGQSWSGQTRGSFKKDSPIYTELTLTPEKNWLGRVVRVWATRKDITAQKKLEQLVRLDELTGLYNRHYYNETIEEEINRSKREEQVLCVAMVDIDLFKQVNDYYGHQRGDEVLQKVANILKSRFSRANDFVYRMGGEEFLILTHFESPAEFEDYLNDVRRQVMALNIPNEHAPLKILTLSFGGLFCSVGHIPDANTLYRKVDDGLYRSKEGGRNKVEVSIC